MNASAADCRWQINRLIEGRMEIRPKVEPLLCRAFKQAVAAIPLEHRRLLKGLTVTRRIQPVLPETSTLAEELKAALVFAVYRPNNGVLELTNSLWRGESRWFGGFRPEDQARQLVNDLFAGDNKVPPEDRWQQLLTVLKIDSTEDIRVKRPGHPMVLDRLLQTAQVNLWGGTLSRRDILLHVLGRVILHRLAEGSEWLHLAQSWGQLSGWQNPHQGAALETWPFVVGEAPEVWLRTALGYSPGPKARFLFSGKSAFPSPLARLSPSLDFAECYRTALTNPTLLAKNSPEKLMAVNALSWWAPKLKGGKHELFVSKAVLNLNQGRLLARGAKGILGSKGFATAAGPQIALATLRAHRELLTLVIDQLPSHPPLLWPADIPKALSEQLNPARMQIEIAGKILRPAPERVRVALEHALRRYVEERTLPKSAARELQPGERLKTAVKQVTKMAPSFEQATALADLASELARAERFAEATRLIQLIPGGFWGPHERMRALIAVANAQLRNANWTGVADALIQCERVLTSVSIDAWHTRFREQIAELYLLAGRYEDAKRLVTGLRNTPRGQMAKVSITAKMALALVRDGHREQGQKLLQRALSLVEKLKNPQWKAKIQATIKECQRRLLDDSAP
jgi:hypothetical protein